MFKIFQKISLENINQIVEEIKNDSQAHLIDVRTQQEFRGGHIPGSVNLPLDRAHTIEQIVPDKKTKLVVYCHSGARSAQAVGVFKRLGYEDVINAGGILDWTGSVRK